MEIELKADYRVDFWQCGEVQKSGVYNPDGLYLGSLGIPLGTCDEHSQLLVEKAAKYKLVVRGPLSYGDGYIFYLRAADLD